MSGANDDRPVLTASSDVPHDWTAQATKLETELNRALSSHALEVDAPSRQTPNPWQDVEHIAVLVDRAAQGDTATRSAR